MTIKISKFTFYIITLLRHTILKKINLTHAHSNVNIIYWTEFLTESKSIFLISRVSKKKTRN